jgi:hypothetical protein
MSPLELASAFDVITVWFAGELVLWGATLWDPVYPQLCTPVINYLLASLAVLSQPCIVLFAFICRRAGAVGCDAMGPARPSTAAHL